MPNLAEAATLFLYGYWGQADGEKTPDLMDDRRGVSTRQLAAGLVMDLVLQGCLRLEHPYVSGRLKQRRRSYRRIAVSLAILLLVLVLALFFGPLLVLASAFPAFFDQVWGAVAYVLLTMGVWLAVVILVAVLVGKPLQRWLSGKMELVACSELDDLHHLALGHLQQLGQRKPTFDYVRRAWKGGELRELREKLKEQLQVQGCLIEQERPANLLLRVAGDGRAVNRDHPAWLALCDQLRALILERRVTDAQTAALAILLSVRGRPAVKNQTRWVVTGLYQCFTPHEYEVVTARRKEIIAQQDAAIAAALGDEVYDALLAIRAVSSPESSTEL